MTIEFFRFWLIKLVYLFDTFTKSEEELVVKFTQFVMLFKSLKTWMLSHITFLLLSLTLTHYLYQS